MSDHELVAYLIMNVDFSVLSYMLLKLFFASNIKNGMSYTAIK